jgi:ubiquinone/menaquinone biosynthesis C-methylase UbiE/uncharacterized protein YbaR (Trm112 family)
MRRDVIDLLVCPVCGQHPLAYQAFAGEEEAAIPEGVVWCTACGQWFPIEDGLLEFLAGSVAYAEDRLRFGKRYEKELTSLGLQPLPPRGEQSDRREQQRQQAHSDWYASNSLQTYSSYEKTSFWRAADALAFDEWRSEMRAGARLLDVGCAQGRSTFKLMDLDLEIVAFDISKALVRQALARYQGQPWQATATFFVADATRFPFIGRCFDYVLIYGVLHHLVDPGATCQEIARVLKPGGVYYGQENNRTIFRAIFDFFQRRRPLWHEEAGEHATLSKQEFQDWLQTLGFLVTTRTSVFLPPHFLNELSFAKARQFLRITDRLAGSMPFLRDHGGVIIVKGTSPQKTGVA